MCTFSRNFLCISKTNIQTQLMIKGKKNITLLFCEEKQPWDDGWVMQHDAKTTLEWQLGDGT